MPNKCNQRLRSIADSSAIKQSVIPAFVCDDALLVTSKSIGAQKSFSRPAINGNFANHIPSEAARKIECENASPFCTVFSMESGYRSHVIVTQGQVKGEKYTAFIIEPQIVFLRTHNAWYMTDAFKHIAQAVDNLLNDPLLPVSKLDLCCLRVSRLCSFSDQPTTLLQTDIAYSLREIMKACSGTLMSIGGHAEFRIETQPMFLTTCSNNQIYMLTSALLVAAVPMSDDGNVDIYCNIDEKNDRVEISHTIIPSKEYRKKFSDIDEFIKSVPHLRLELAALKDMTEHCEIDFGCRTDGDNLTIYYNIYARKTNYVVLGAPILQDESKKYLTNLFGYLQDIVRFEKAE